MANKFLDASGLTQVFSIFKEALSGKSDSNHTHKYAGSSSTGGAATKAVALTTSAGDANTPVYFSGGKPVACTSLDLNTTGSSASCTGNAATATKAMQDGSGNNIIDTYSTKSELQELQEEIETLTQRLVALESALSGLDSLATVATTGSYKDLKDLPTKINEIKQY